METISWHTHYDYCVPSSIRYPRLPVHELLQVPANAYPDKAAIHFMGRELTFWELRQHVIRIAYSLGAMGIKKGDRVGIHLPTCPQYIISYYAVLSLGAIVVNLNPLYTIDELTGTAQNTGMTTLITSDMSLHSARELCRTVPIRHAIVTRVDDYAADNTRGNDTPLGLEKGWYRFLSLLEGASGARTIRADVRPEDIAVIQFTGGTTGIPKGAMLTHANIVAAAFQYTLWMTPLLSLIPPERRSILIAIPLYHVYGNLAMNWSILNCVLQIHMPRFHIDEMVHVMESYKEITFFPTVATVVSALLNHPRTGDLNLGKKLTQLNSGGGPTAPHLIEQLNDMGIYFSQAWGMSETSGLGTSTPVFGAKKINSIGIPYPDTDIRVVDLSEGIQDVPRGEPGEIIIRGATLMKGYWENPEETAGQIKNGWLHTGDIAVKDEDDFLYIVDRKKDMIIAGGFNIYPSEIDEVLFTHPKVQFAVAAGIPDAYRGETVKAYIVLKQGMSATAEEIIAFCREKLAPYKVPRIIEFRDALPQSSVGKILRKELRTEEETKIKNNQ